MLESFGESPKACVTNSSRPLEKLKGKENPDLPLVCSNYWPPNVALSLCFNHLVFSTFRQCRSAIPKRSDKPLASYFLGLAKIRMNQIRISHVISNQKTHEWRDSFTTVVKNQTSRTFRLVFENAHKWKPHLWNPQQARRTGCSLKIWQWPLLFPNM